MFAQNESVDYQLKDNAPKVYLRCSCDMDYIRQEITFVNFVRDQAEADINIIVYGISTGGGGYEYNIEFNGTGKYYNLNDTLKYISKIDDTGDIIRQNLARKIKLGLIPYINKSPLADYMDVKFEKEVEATDVTDPWNSWVFSMSSDIYMNGEKLTNYKNIWSSFNADRVTEDLKMNYALSNNYNENNYIIDDTNYKSISRSINANALIVKSIDEHFSLGGIFYAYQSTYSNIDFTFKVAPAVEYDIFPYKEATSQQFTLLYQVGYRYFSYVDTTIYLRTKESLFMESFTTAFKMIKSWGSVNISLTASNYFFDFRKNNLDLWISLSCNVFSGLNINTY
ncbi:MAG: hypothetical protein HZB41_12045, partial [Ignavibacteriae bacterium]|nr:hypothetical protein [Ignavibacteriota bacterium]